MEDQQHLTELSSGPQTTVPVAQTSGDHESICARGHPFATAFHLVFKIAALVFYLILSNFFDSFVIIFITVVMLVAFDFWTVKNVTGRKMVGMRWWNQIKPDGSSVWRFESLRDESRLLRIEKLIFWVALFGAPIIWFIFAITALLGLKLEWLTIVIVALAMGMANVVGYVKCARDARKKLREMATGVVTRAVVSSVVSSSLGGQTSQAPQGAQPQGNNSYLPL